MSTKIILAFFCILILRVLVVNSQDGASTVPTPQESSAPEARRSSRLIDILREMNGALQILLWEKEKALKNATTFPNGSESNGEGESPARKYLSSFLRSKYKI